MSPGVVLGQFIYGEGPSNSQFFSGVINVPPAIGDSETVSWFQVNVGDDGSIGQDFTARDSVEVNISGGTVGDGFRVRDSEVNISGGMVGDNLDLFNSAATINGGSVGSGVSVREGSWHSINGNRFILGNSIVLISRGVLGRSFRVANGEKVELIGGDFRLNGEPYTTSSITLSDGDMFTGTLASGNTFLFTRAHGDWLQNVQLTSATLPPSDPTPVAIDFPVRDRDSVLHAGSTYLLQANGVIGDDHEIINTTLDIDGGLLGASAVAAIGAKVNLIDGTIGPEFQGMMGSEVNVRGGTVGSDFQSWSGNRVNISGGTVGHSFTAHQGSEVSVSGGALGGIRAREGSVVNVSGGTIDQLRTFTGSTVQIRGGVFGRGFSAGLDSVELVGGEFQLNGSPYTGSTIQLSERDVFAGTLADGSPFAFRPMPNRIGSDQLLGVRLTNVSLPAADLTPLTVDTATPSRPMGLRPGQTLTLEAGGELSDNFEVVGGTLNVTGGHLGENAAIVDGVANISAGTVGSTLEALYGSVVNVDGGTVGNSFSAMAGSELNIRAGVLAGVDAYFDSGVDVSGGFIGEFNAFAGSQVSVRGGVFDSFSVWEGSEAELIGGEFHLNGSFYDHEVITLVDGDVLTGTLVDGSAFFLRKARGNGLFDVKLTREPFAPVEQTSIVIDSVTPNQLLALRREQTLTLRNGGLLEGNVNAVGATLNVEGGAIENDVTIVGGIANMSGGRIGELHALTGSEISISGGATKAVARDGSVFNISGGRLDDFFAGDGSLINITGGRVDGIRASAGSKVDVTGGIIGQQFVADRESAVSISGGVVGDFFTAFANSLVDIDGGVIGNRFNARGGSGEDGGSVVNIRGGVIGDGFWAQRGSNVTISGGSLGREFFAFDDSNVELVGGEFRLNGEPYTEPAITLTQGVFTGILSDGSPFSFIAREDRINDVKLTNVPLPAPDTSVAVIDAPHDRQELPLKAGQTLVLQPGGEIGDDFKMAHATLNVEGGLVGDDADVFNAIVSLSSGAIGNRFQAQAGSQITIDGGTVGAGFTAVDTTVTITDGVVGAGFDVFESEISILGGSVGLEVVGAGSKVNISGGTLGPRFVSRSGSEFNIVGTDFVVNGQPMDDLIEDETHTFRRRVQSLTGVLLDGTPIEFPIGFATDAAVTVTLSDSSVSSANEICSAVAAGNGDLSFDANEDGVVTYQDVLFAITAKESVLGDLDFEGNVAFEDFLKFSTNFGADEAIYSMGDLDCNYSVTFPDFLVLSTNFGTGHTAEVESVPEPNAGRFMLMAAGIACVLGRRHRERRPAWRSR